MRAGLMVHFHASHSFRFIVPMASFKGKPWLLDSKNYVLQKERSTRPLKTTDLLQQNWLFLKMRLRGMRELVNLRELRCDRTSLICKHEFDNIPSTLSFSVNEKSRIRWHFIRTPSMLFYPGESEVGVCNLHGIEKKYIYRIYMIIEILFMNVRRN